MELELKHLSPYLPYGLKWTIQELKTFTMSGITHSTLYTEEGSVLSWQKHPDLPQALFPILRPLSDLTKEIEVGGEKFVPKEELGLIHDVSGNRILNFRTGEEMNILSFPYYLIEILFKWHFDCYDLISNNLAIDINTLQE